MNKYIPDRKVWAGGVFMILAFVGITALNATGYASIPMEGVAVAAFVLGKFAEYFIPPSWLDKIKRIDDDLVEAAALDPASKVSPEVAAAVKGVRSRSYNEIMRKLGS